MKHYKVPAEVFDQLLAPYLGSRPWREVAPIMDALRALKMDDGGARKRKVETV